MIEATTYRARTPHGLPLGTHLCAEEEAPLFRRARGGDAAALSRIVEAHVGLVISVAARYQRHGQPMEDLVQEGCVGLLEAARRFDEDRGVRFSTYAVPWIRVKCQTYTIRSKGAVKGFTTETQRLALFRVPRAERALALAGREATPAALARATGVPEKDVEMALYRANPRDASLDAPIAEGGEPHVAQLPSGVDVLAEIEATDERRNAARVVERALGRLSFRDRSLLRMRYLGREPMTLEEIGCEFGVTRERVRQLEQRALDRFRRALAAPAKQKLLSAPKEGNG